MKHCDQLAGTLAISDSSVLSRCRVVQARFKRLKIRQRQTLLVSVVRPWKFTLAFPARDCVTRHSSTVDPSRCSCPGAEGVCSTNAHGMRRRTAGSGMQQQSGYRLGTHSGYRSTSTSRSDLATVPRSLTAFTHRLLAITLPVLSRPGPSE